MQIHGIVKCFCALERNAIEMECYDRLESTCNCLGIIECFSCFSEHSIELSLSVRLL